MVLDDLCWWSFDLVMVMCVRCWIRLVRVVYRGHAFCFVAFVVLPMVCWRERKKETNSKLKKYQKRRKRKKRERSQVLVTVRSHRIQPSWGRAAYVV